LICCDCQGGYSEAVTHVAATHLQARRNECSQACWLGVICIILPTRRLKHLSITTGGTITSMPLEELSPNAVDDEATAHQSTLRARTRSRPWLLIAPTSQRRMGQDEWDTAAGKPNNGTQRDPVTASDHPPYLHTLQGGSTLQRWESEGSAKSKGNRATDCFVTRTWPASNRRTRPCF
jgi:hypothetical protein